jgi:hypothetical protein
MPGGDQRRALTLEVADLGYWGQNPLGGFGRDPAVDIRSICDLDPHRLARFAGRHPDMTLGVPDATDNRKPRSSHRPRLGEPRPVEHALVP